MNERSIELVKPSFKITRVGILGLVGLGLYFSSVSFIQRGPTIISEDHAQRLMLLAFQQRPLLFQKLLDQSISGAHHVSWPVDHNGEGLLHWAVMGSCSSCLELLISLDHPLNDKGSNGRDALSYALELEDIDAMEKLLKAGANPHSFRGDKGEDLFSIAKLMGNEEIIQLLESYR